MSLMLNGCTSLKYLDISNFYIHYQAYVDIIFSGLDKLEAINLFNVQNGELLSEEIEKLKDGLNVCQKDDIISEDKANNICKNFIKACFRENVIYENGFNYIKENKTNEYRNRLLVLILIHLIYFKLIQK